ncbi:MAG TPA: Clp protease N-terminal domain-containing protein [Candidatus Acidoferrales bacterium]|jgi:ATP-dependent Clp protease ATP-binding subunit ClpA|nr:Clp protease N-terminal domain-containing protein [Candidatus Acidoferrales bacterium]
MFERYSEKARRVIFFARYEASLFGAPYIEPEHLLLGIVREDKALAFQFLSSHAASEAIREKIEARTTKRERVSTSVDIPLNADSKSVLAYAAEEAPASKEIGTAHLLLGILRLETSFAVEILHGYGLSLDTVRQELQGTAPIGSVKRAHAKPTACRDCKHLIVDGKSTIERMNLYCGASPKEPVFDAYTGELKEGDPGSPPSERFRHCVMVNFGECRLFEAKEGLDQV